MVAFRHRIIGAGLAAFGATGLHRLAAPFTRGKGAILTFHRVIPASSEPFVPNQLLEITPAFLDRLLSHTARRGYRIVPLEDVPGLLAGTDASPFLALTFDDGYRDTLVEALPVLERHQAPFTVFATTGFLDRTARLWWIELELALRQLSSVSIAIDGRPHTLSTRSTQDKDRAFARLMRHFLSGSDKQLLDSVAAVTAQAGTSGPALVDRLCMDWTALGRLAGHPLARIGCHTLTHPRLACRSADRAVEEMIASKRAAGAGTRPADHDVVLPLRDSDCGWAPRVRHGSGGRIRDRRDDPAGRPDSR